MNKVNQYPLGELSCNKWPKNESDRYDDEYEVHILKYDANQYALAENKREPHWRRRRSQIHHHNWCMKKKNTHKTNMTNLVRHVVDSQSNYGTGKGGSSSYVHKYRHKYK